MRRPAAAPGSDDLGAARGAGAPEPGDREPSRRAAPLRPRGRDPPALSRAAEDVHGPGGPRRRTASPGDVRGPLGGASCGRARRGLVSERERPLDEVVGEHPSADTLIDMAFGYLDPGLGAAVLAHVSGCPRCEE